MKRQRATISRKGSLLIPLAQREALGLRPGDQVVLSIKGNELRMCSLRVAVRRAQAVVMKHIEPSVSLVNELIEERRQEGKIGDSPFEERT